jgi:hypothetical protein
MKIPNNCNNCALRFYCTFYNTEKYDFDECSCIFWERDKI